VGGRNQSGGKIEEGRFAAAARSNDGDEFARVDGEVDAIDGGVIAESLGDFFEVDGGGQKVSLNYR